MYWQQPGLAHWSGRSSCASRRFSPRHGVRTACPFPCRAARPAPFRRDRRVEMRGPSPDKRPRRRLAGGRAPVEPVSTSKPVIEKRGTGISTSRRPDAIYHLPPAPLLHVTCSDEGPAAVTQARHRFGTCDRKPCARPRHFVVQVSHRARRLNPSLRLHAIQGAGDASPLDGEDVTVEAIVTGSSPTRTGTCAGSSYSRRMPIPIATRPPQKSSSSSARTPPWRSATRYAKEDPVSIRSRWHSNSHPARHW
jgi:hypothetical protein